MDRDRVIVAVILRTRGIRGEVVAFSQTDIPGRLEGLRSATLRLRTGDDLPVELESVWLHEDNWILKFRGFDSIEAAERLRGADLWVPFANRGELPPGDFFQSDLLGCSVVDALSGECIGKVEGWQGCGGPPLMEVVAGGRECLIPFVGSMCEVDLWARTIRMPIPQGLLEL